MHMQVDLRVAWADHFEEQQLTAKRSQAAELQAAKQLKEARAQAAQARQARQAERAELQVHSHSLMQVASQEYS